MVVKTVQMHIEGEDTAVERFTKELDELIKKYSDDLEILTPGF